MAYCTFDDVFSIIKNDLDLDSTDADLQNVVNNAIDAATQKIDLQTASITKTDSDNIALKFVCMYYAASDVSLAYFAGGSMGDTYNKPLHYEKKGDDFLKSFIKSKKGISSVIDDTSGDSASTEYYPIEYAITKDV